MLGRVFKAYDVRGTYPDLLNDQMAWQIGFGVSRFLRGEAEAAGQTNPMMRNIVVGRDMRASSPSLARSLISGINAQGGDVIDVGLVDTPFVTFAINHLGCAGGVMVTASHNPPQYNGFKVSRRQGKPVGEMNGLAEVRKYAAMVDTTIGRGAGGRSETRDLWEAYARHVLRTLDLKRPLKIVIDASNGMAGAMVPRVFGKGGSNVKGLTIVEVNFEHTKGNFAHEPNPLVSANLAQTQEAVKANKADLGVCFDGDADRLVVVDEKGAIIGCDHLTALLAKWFLARAPGGGDRVRSALDEGGGGGRACGRREAVPVPGRARFHEAGDGGARLRVRGGTLRALLLPRQLLCGFGRDRADDAADCDLVPIETPECTDRAGAAVRAVGRDQLRERGGGRRAGCAAGAVR